VSGIAKPTYYLLPATCYLLLAGGVRHEGGTQQATRRCQPPASDTAARYATRAEHKKRAETLISISALSVEIELAPDIIKLPLNIIELALNIIKLPLNIIELALNIIKLPKYIIELAPDIIELALNIIQLPLNIIKLPKYTGSPVCTRRALIGGFGGFSASGLEAFPQVLGYDFGVRHVPAGGLFCRMVKI
jgi:hypothetical protein